MKLALTFATAFLTAFSLHAQSPVFSIAQGGSMLCAGTLYDTGGPNNDYTNNEDFSFVICPNTPAACITFTLEYYHLEPSLPDAVPQGQGDQLYFYDGPSVNSPLLAALDGAAGSPENIAGGGGVCFQVQSSSGCLTVRFKSDATLREEGWKGSWTCSPLACTPVEMVKIDTMINQAALEAAVSTSGASVTVTSINCIKGGMGIFTHPTGDNLLGMGSGLLLSSGQALNALGPNDDIDAGSSNAPFGIDDLGDPDLDYLSTVFGGGSSSEDVCILEMDVEAFTDEVVFEYVFGSEEYPEFVFNENGFNDIFAFLVSGPGIAGDPNLSNNARNVAVLPNSTTPVQIDSVNNIVHWEYFRNNEISQELQYDGLTSDYFGVKKSLTARVPVIPCNVYHLKLAIGDRGDDRLDSGVFISEIKAGSPDISIAFNSGVDYFAEQCTGNMDSLYFTLNKAPTTLAAYVVSFGGSASFGLDYLTNIPDTVRFQPGQQSIGFPIAPLTDNLTEGEETILITISRDYGCGSVDLATFSARILDQVDVVIEGSDTLNVCKGQSVQLTATGADSYVWSPSASLNNPLIANPIATPVASAWIKVTGTLGACTGVDSVFVRVINPTIDANSLGSAIICQGGNVQLEANSNGTSISWSPTIGLSDPSSIMPVATPSVTTTYYATAELEGCPAVDSVLVTVESLVLPDLIDNLTVCQNIPVQLANLVNSTNSYSWTPELGLSDPNISAPIATPDFSTWYILTVNSANEVCPEWKDSVLVQITPADIAISGAHYRRVCLGSPAFELQAVTNPPNATVTWTPSEYLSSNTGSTVTCTPLESVGITASMQANGCPVVFDSIFIRVDSLPNDSIWADPMRQFYCPGDTVYLLSKEFVPGDSIHGGFPDIQYKWDQFGTQLEELDKWQMIIVASDTNLYIRRIWNGACFDTSVIQINVPEPPQLPFEVEPDTICPGGSAHIRVFPNPANTELEWDPMSAGTLSCDDCTDLFATPLVTTTYHATTPMASCPSSIAVEVVVRSAPLLDLNESAISCNLAPVQLNFTHESGVIYTWDPALFLDFGNIGNPTATPTQSGEFPYHVTAKYENGTCLSEGDVTLFVYDASIQVLAPFNICAGTTLTLSTETTGNPGNITWSPGGPEILFTMDTTITASLHYGDMCVEFSEVQIDVIPLPLLDMANDTTVCQGAPVQLNATNDPANVTYTWTPTNGLPVPNNIGNPLATPLDTTTYQLLATTIVGGCTRTGEVTLRVAEALVNAGANKSICFGESTVLTASAFGAPGGDYSWSNGQSGNNITVSPSTDQTFTVTYTVANCTDMEEVTVMVNNPRLSDITAPNDTVCRGAAVGLKVFITSPAGGTLAWFADGVEIPNETKDTLTIRPISDVSYSVVLTDDAGCTDESGPVQINTKNCLEVPNAFTPNGDGSNDTFRPLFFGGTAEVLRFEVYSRWGEKVFATGPEKEAWDGTFGGKPAMSDVYVYVVQVRFGNGEEEKRSGEVTLLR